MVSITWQDLFTLKMKSSLALLRVCIVLTIAEIKKKKKKQGKEKKKSSSFFILKICPETDSVQSHLKESKCS